MESLGQKRECLKEMDALGTGCSTVLADDEQPSTSTRGRSSWEGGAGREEEEAEFFRAEDIALNEMHHSVRRLVGQFCTHSTNESLQLITDISCRYMRSLATRIAMNAQHAGRILANLRDAELAYEDMRISVEEMNLYMRTVRPVKAREVARFPVEEKKPLIRYAEVSYEELFVVRAPLPACSRETDSSPPAGPSLPPISSKWITHSETNPLLADRKKPAHELCAKFNRLVSESIGEKLPSFLSTTATALRLHHTKRPEKSAAEEDEIIAEQEKGKRGKGGRRRGKKDRAEQSSLVQSREKRMSTRSTTGYSKTFQYTSSEPLPASSFFTPASLKSSELAAPSPSSVAVGSAPTTRSAFLDPEDEVLFEEEAVIVTVKSPVAAYEEEPNVTPRNESPEHPQAASPISSPPLSPDTLYGEVPEDAPPNRLVQLAILRGLFSKDRDVPSELTEVFTYLKTGVRRESSQAEQVPTATAVAPLRLKINIAAPPIEEELMEEEADPSPEVPDEAESASLQSPPDDEGTRKKKKKHKKHKHRRERETGEEPMEEEQSEVPPPVRLKIRLGPRPSSKAEE